MNHLSRSPGFSVGVVLLSGAASIAAFAQIPLVGVPGQQGVSAAGQGTGGDCGRFRARKTHGAAEIQGHLQTGYVEVKYPNATREQPTIGPWEGSDAGRSTPDSRRQTRVTPQLPETIFSRSPTPAATRMRKRLRCSDLHWSSTAVAV